MEKRWSVFREVFWITPSVVRDGGRGSTGGQQPVPSTGAARAARNGWLWAGQTLPECHPIDSRFPASAVLSSGICQRHRSQPQPSGLLRPLFHAEAAVPTRGYRPGGGDGAGHAPAAAGGAGVAHITPQVDPVLGGPTGERGPGGTQPTQSLGRAGAGGRDRGRGRAGTGIRTGAGTGAGPRRGGGAAPCACSAARHNSGGGSAPVAADRGWFELVRCHSDARRYK